MLPMSRARTFKQPDPETTPKKENNQDNRDTPRWDKRSDACKVIDGWSSVLQPEQLKMEQVLDHPLNGVVLSS